jgi:hypothetical protein
VPLALSPRMWLRPIETATRLVNEVSVIGCETLPLASSHVGSPLAETTRAFVKPVAERPPAATATAPVSPVKTFVFQFDSQSTSVPSSHKRRTELKAAKAGMSKPPAAIPMTLVSPTWMWYPQFHQATTEPALADWEAPTNTIRTRPETLAIRKRAFDTGA